MSASSEKRRRQTNRDQGVDKRSLAQREAEEKAKKSNRNWAICGVLIAVLVVGILLVNAFMYQIPALKVGGQNYSAAEVKYYYTEMYYTYLSYGMVNNATPLEEQICSLAEEEGTTWDAYLKQQVTTRLETNQALYEQAQAAGFSLSDDGKAQVESNMNSLKTTAENSHISLRKLLTRYYGEGVTPKLMEKIITRDILISEYQASVQDGFTYSDEELDTYFDEHAADYRTYDYLYYFIKAETQEPEEEEGEPVEDGNDTTPADNQEDATPVDDPDDATAPEGEADEEGEDETEEPEIDPAVQEAIITANGMAAYVTDEESFTEAVNAYVEGDKPQKASNVAAGNVMSDWITEEGREYGEAVVANSEDGAYVIMFVSSEDQKYSEISVRHILVKTEDADEDGTYSEEELAAAKEKAEALLAEWEAGDKTEESFAAMAEEHSEDEGSKTNGGLYENVYKGAMVQEFNDFCFAEDRAAGDTGIVHGNNGGYDGYHVMYFVGDNGPLHSRTLAKQSLSGEAYEEWETGILEGVTSTVKFGMKLVKI